MSRLEHYLEMTRLMFLERCLTTPGLRRIGVRSLAPAFYSKGEPRYRPIPPNFRDLPGRFLVAGFPKSGNVWLVSLLSSCLDLPVDAGDRTYVYLTQKTCRPELMFERNLWRGVVVIRDPRDVLVSLFHYMKGDHFVSTFGPHHKFDTIESMYTQYFRPYFTWSLGTGFSGLPEGYIRWGWPVVRYEDLWEDPARELRRLFARWAIEVPEEKIQAAVEANSLDNMRAGKGNVRAEVQKAHHFRRGGWGSFLDELPEAVLADFEQRYIDDLRNWGYWPVTDLSGARTRIAPAGDAR